MHYTDWRISFRLKDGRVLTCEYTTSYDPGGMWEPPNWDISSPEYKIDNKAILYDDLPEGLHVLAALMYDNPDSEYGRHYFIVKDVTGEDND